MGDSRGLKGTLGDSRGHNMGLQGTLGHSRRLQETLGDSGRLSESLRDNIWDAKVPEETSGDSKSLKGRPHGISGDSRIYRRL